MKRKKTTFEKKMTGYIRRFAENKIAAIYGQFVFQGKTYFDLLGFYDALVAEKKIKAMSDDEIMEYCNS